MDDKAINRKLKENFGELNGEQIFRLARTNQLEYRRNALWEVELLPKYSYFNRHYWVVEKLMPVSGTNTEILVGKKLSYEPLFVFKHGNSDLPLPVSEDVVLSLVHVHLFGEKRSKTRDFEAEELDFYEKQIDRFTQFLNDECSPISTQLHFGEAVVKPQSQKLESSPSNGNSDVSVPSPEGNS